MKTLTLAAIRCSLIFTAVAALSLAYPAAVQAVPTTYQYTGNPFTDVSGLYTTSDFVSGMVTLAAPLPPNFQGTVTPTAFTFSDGVQTITDLTATIAQILFSTGPTGLIQKWHIDLERDIGDNHQAVGTVNDLASSGLIADFAIQQVAGTIVGEGQNMLAPGVWVTRSAVADTGSTLSMLTLTLMALGVAARQFKRAAA